MFYYLMNHVVGQSSAYLYWYGAVLVPVEGIEGFLVALLLSNLTVVLLYTILGRRLFTVVSRKQLKSVNYEQT
jgi:hypothetical protein